MPPSAFREYLGRKSECVPGEHTLIWRLGGTVNGDIKVSQVIFMGNGINSGNTITHVKTIESVAVHAELRGQLHECSYGSAMRRSVSLIMRLGKAMLDLFMRKTKDD